MGTTIRRTTIRRTTFRRIAATTLIAGDTVAAAEAAFTKAGFRDVTLSTQVADPTVSTVTGSNNLPNTYQFVDDVIVLDVAFPARDLPDRA